MGIKIKPPDINNSELTFTPVPKDRAILYGLSAIKNVGEKAVKLIVKQRSKKQFTDIFDFVERTKDRLVTSRTVESLVLAGAFDSLYEDRATCYATVKNAIERSDMLAEDKKRIAAGGKPVNRKKPIPTLDMVDYEFDGAGPDLSTLLGLLSAERELLGTYVSGHPFDEYKQQISKLNTVSLHAVRDEDPGSLVTICGIVSVKNVIKTKKKLEMATLVIEDSSVSIEVIVFPSKYKDYKDEILLDQPLVITGRLESDDDDDKPKLKIKLERCNSLDSAPQIKVHKAAKTVNKYHLSYDNYRQQIASAKSPCTLVLPNGDEYLV
jgi:DNA polymerase-3 subunit alpha